jgi:hypothetical protein
MAVTDRTQQQEQTRPFWPGRARGLVKLPSPRCSRRATVRPPSPEPPLRPPEVVQPRPGLARPDPDGARRAQIWAGRTPPASPRRPTAKERPPRHLATRATPSRAPPPSEHREPESTAAGRGEPRATLTSSRVEARPPPPAPRGLSPAACADGGGGGGGGEGVAAAARDFAPTTARGGRCGALFRGRNRREKDPRSEQPTTWPQAKKGVVGAEAAGDVALEASGSEQRVTDAVRGEVRRSSSRRSASRETAGARKLAVKTTLVPEKMTLP